MEGKKKKRKDRESTSLETGDNVEEAGTGSGGESLKKRRKKIVTSLETGDNVDEAGTGSGGEPQKKSKEKKKKILTSLETGDNVDEAGTGSGGESQKKRKKKKKKILTSLETGDNVDEAGTGSGGESQKKSRKKKKILTSLETGDNVDEAGTGSGGEPQKKRKKKKILSSLETDDNVDEAGTGSGGESQKKRKEKKVLASLEAADNVDEAGTGSGGESLKKRRKKKILTSLETADNVDEAGTGSGGESQKKRRKKKIRTSSSTVGDGEPEPGTATKPILKTQELPTGNGSESARKKKVSFQLPDAAEDDPSEDEELGEGIETTHVFTELEGSAWITDRLRSDLVYGMYTPEEDGALKQAIFDYIQERGWDRETGLQKILNSRKGDARGCWHTIRKCLPQRDIKRLYARAHRLLDPGNYLGKWTNEETESLIQLHSVHGNDWRRISTIIGRDSTNCKDKWRSIKFSVAVGRKMGPWSKEEQQKLCALVLKCLHVKKQMAERGQIKKTFKVIRDDINWEFIAEHMGGRNRLECLNQWYGRMASPMVRTGEWSNGDDQRLLARLLDEFPLSEELVEWDSLLEDRSGEVCKKRWEQMQRPIGRAVRRLHFLERLESVIERFAPHLLNSEYDQEFAADLQRAEETADQSEDVNT